MLDFLLIFFVFMVGMVWYWHLYPYNPLEIEQPLRVLNEDKTVVAGEILRYHCHFTKHTDKIPAINRRLVDGITYSFPETKPRNPVGENEFTCTLEIPRSIPEGNYRLDTQACYRMNPVREVCVEYSTDEFKVIK